MNPVSAQNVAYQMRFIQQHEKLLGYMMYYVSKTKKQALANLFSSC